jgi:hypothetical protein
MFTVDINREFDNLNILLKKIYGLAFSIIIGYGSTLNPPADLFMI